MSSVFDVSPSKEVYTKTVNNELLEKILSSDNIDMYLEKFFDTVN